MWKYAISGARPVEVTEYISKHVFARSSASFKFSKSSKVSKLSSIAFFLVRPLVAPKARVPGRKQTCTASMKETNQWAVLCLLLHKVYKYSNQVNPIFQGFARTIHKRISLQNILKIQSTSCNKKVHRLAKIKTEHNRSSITITPFQIFNWSDNTSTYATLSF